LFKTLNKKESDLSYKKYLTETNDTILTFDDFVYDVTYQYKDFSDLDIDPFYTKLRVKLLRPYFGLNQEELKIRNNLFEVDEIDKILKGNYNFYNVNFPYFYSLAVPCDSLLAKNLQRHYQSITEARDCLAKTRDQYITSLLYEIVEKNKIDVLVEKKELIKNSLQKDVKKYEWYMDY
jgi:hypothetical protein